MEAGTTPYLAPECFDHAIKHLSDRWALWLLLLGGSRVRKQRTPDCLTGCLPVPACRARVCIRERDGALASAQNEDDWMSGRCWRRHGPCF